MCSVGAAGVAMGMGGMFAKQEQISAENTMQTEELTQKIALNKIKAQEAINAGQIAENAKRAETRKVLGAQSAAMASSGLQTGTGTFERIKENTAQTGELDARTIQKNAMTQAWGYEAENVMMQNKINSLNRAANAKQWGAALSGAGTLIGGFGG